MKILGIETSTKSCGLALASDSETLAISCLPEESRPTASLVPAIRDLCCSVGWSPCALELICVDIGPGSYTGLRVGLTCAKTLAFSAGAHLATARSLDVVAHSVSASASVAEVAFDAARGQVFACRFQRLDDAWSPCHAIRIVEAQDWARQLSRGAIVLGPALNRYRALLAPSFRVAEESMWQPHAEWVIRLGLEQFKREPIQQYWDLEPLYMRPSAAEEKRADAKDRLT